MIRGRGRFSRVLTALLALFILLLLNSCEKNRIDDIFMSTGKETTITRDITGNFTKIRLEDGLDLVITTGKPYAITLTGGENVLEGVETTITDSCLTLVNKNKFNWVRSYDKRITANVSLPNLVYIEYESSGTISNTDTIRSDSLFVTAYGSGIINLMIDTRSSHLALTRGSVDFNIRGFSGVNYLFADGYGPFHCENLKTGYTFMHTKSTNDCYIRVDFHLEYIIDNIGNIYYKGKPAHISGKKNAEGQLIHVE